jgi:hypothetical protein
MISLTLAIALVIGTWEITKLPDKITGKQNCYVMHSKDNKVRLEKDRLRVVLDIPWPTVRFRFDDGKVLYSLHGPVLRTGQRVSYNNGHLPLSDFNIATVAKAKRLRYSAGNPPSEIFSDIEMAETAKVLAYLQNKEECQNGGR